MRKEIYFYKKGYRITSKGEAINPDGITLKGSNDCKDYLRISTKLRGKSIFCYFHRLQAFQKYGLKIYEDGIEVRHLDGNSLNNSYNNISIGSHKDNSLDIPEDIRTARALHATSFVRKYDKNEVKEFHKKNGNSYAITMEHFEISSKGTLHYILNN